MASTRSMMAFVLLLGILLSSVDNKLLAAAQAPPPAPDGGVVVSMTNCTFQNASMISTTACTYYDKQNTASQTGNCQAFLTNLEATPDAGCCAGLNQVAYYRPACICDVTFYPSDLVNSTRSLQLPSLCGVRIDLCTHCSQFLVPRTDEYPVGGVEKRSRAARIAAIVLGVILSAALVGAAIALTVTELKKRKQDKDAPEVFDVQPPGGAF